jgi:RNA polymerase sigma-70 factor (ECF subfamily)
MYRGNSAEVFQQVYEKVFPTLIRIAYSITEDMVVAEDLCHEAFIRYYERMLSFPNVDQSKYWLIRVVKNLAFNHQKRKNRELIAYSKYYKEPKPEEESGETQLVKKEMIHQTKAALNQLPEKFRDVLILREYGNLNYREIAKILKITEGNVKVRVHRAREQLSEILKKGGVDVS